MSPIFPNYSHRNFSAACHALAAPLHTENTTAPQTRGCLVWAQQDSNLRPSGYEPPALTTELWAQKMRPPEVFPRRLKSGRRDSNPRMSAWKADALPLGDSRVHIVILMPAPTLVKAFLKNQLAKFIFQGGDQHHDSLVIQSKAAQKSTLLQGAWSDPCRTRTCNQLIKSQLLYRLS